MPYNTYTIRIDCREDFDAKKVNHVIPLTSKTDRLCPSEAIVILDGKESKAMADQLTTVRKLRLFKRAGILSGDDMLRIGDAIKVQLGLY